MHDDDKKNAEPLPRRIAACPKMWKAGGKYRLCNLDTGHLGDCATREGITSALAKVML